MSVVSESMPKVKINVRWLIRADMPSVLGIEQDSFTEPWDEERFKVELARRDQIGMVAEVGGVVVGYMIYLLCKDRVELLTMAVAPEWRRMGVATALLGKLKGKLSGVRRTRLVAYVHEELLGMQLTLRANGLRAVVAKERRLNREFYKFTYKIDQEAA